MNKKYLSVFIVLIVFTTGIFFKYFLKVGWQFFEVIDTLSSIALAILAVYGYFEYAGNEERIKIYFKIDGKLHDTGLSLLRKNFTRSEVMGVLGMIQKNQKTKFHLSFFQNKNVLEKLQKIQTGSEKKFIIEMTKEEAKQFYYENS